MPKKPSNRPAQYNAGDLIFAKMKGYPHWPARIDDLPEGAVKPPSKKYPIFFFGTHETGFLAATEIYPYEEYKKKFGQPRQRPFYNAGLWEIENDPTVMFRGRGSNLEEQGEEAGSDAISDEEPQNQKSINDPPAPVSESDSSPAEEDYDEESSPEVDTSDDDDFTVKKDGAKASGGSKSAKSSSENDSSHEVEQPPKKKRKKSVQESQKSNEKKPRTQKKKQDSKPMSDSSDLSSSDSETEDVVSSWKRKDAERKEKQKLEAEKRLEEETKKMKAIEKEVDRQQKDISQQQTKNEKKKSKSDSTKHKERKKSKDDRKRKSEVKPEHKPKKKETKKVTKIRQMEIESDDESPKIATKQSKSRKPSAEKATTGPNLLPQQELEMYEKVLKSALTVENPDIDKALSVLDLIEQVQITADLLKKCQSLVTTVKKIRRYRASQKIMDKSDKVYNRFKIIFTGLENGAAVTAAAVTKTVKEKEPSDT
uniref:Hepatoma-derived growth factor-related protein 2-like n=1 Tax=Phallusia mammillata TaxID=59560 RepID=A0A6F9DDP8_9ASCI|nr:hepatoma-derived growth factor-related protein 2-like [Phallusia mammillata]